MGLYISLIFSTNAYKYDHLVKKEAIDSSAQV